MSWLVPASKDKCANIQDFFFVYIYSSVEIPKLQVSSLGLACPTGQSHCPYGNIIDFLN